jgi:N-acetylneuraminic acid mutarotase
MPIKRGAASAATVGDTIYVIGGATTQPWSKENFLSPATPQRGLGTVQAYDPKTNTWKELASMPTPRNHAAIGAVNGKIYVIGGRVGAAFIALASDTSLVEVYDPATDTWGTPGHACRRPAARSPTGCTTTESTSPAVSSRIRRSRRVPHVRGIRPGEQHVVDSSADGDCATWCRRGSHRQSVLCGQR